MKRWPRIIFSHTISIRLCDPVFICKLRILSRLLILTLEDLSLLVLLTMHILHLLDVLHLKILHLNCIFHCFIFENQLLDVHLTTLRSDLSRTVLTSDDPLMLQDHSVCLIYPISRRLNWLNMLNWLWIRPSSRAKGRPKSLSIYVWNKRVRLWLLCLELFTGLFLARSTIHMILHHYMV